MINVAQIQKGRRKIPPKEPYGQIPIVNAQINLKSQNPITQGLRFENWSLFVICNLELGISPRIRFLRNISHVNTYTGLIL